MNAFELTSTMLQDETKTLRSILHNLAEGVIVADQDGSFLFFNAEAERILGIGARDVKPDQWTSVYGCYYPDQTTPYPSEYLPLARAIRGEEALNEMLFVRNPEIPSGVWVTASARPLTDERGDRQGGVLIFRDISERRQACERAERLSRALEQTADSVVITDKSGVIEYVNPAFEATTGYKASEALGQTPRLLKSGKHSEEFYEGLWDIILRGEPFRGTVVNRKKNGEFYWVEQTITPMTDENGKIGHFVSVLKDVTEQRKRQEQELQLRLASEVQQRFYQHQPPAFPGLEIAGAAYPADETGGDYFDFVPMPNNCLGIAVGDVTGHGFGSALVMAETRAYLRSFAKTETDVGTILTRVNDVLAEDLDGGRFVTMLLARLDPGSSSFTYASAGHVPGYLFDPTAKVEFTLESTGFPLGLFPHTEIPTSDPIDLDVGNLLVLLTDGITEAMAPDESEFGIDRIFELIRTCHECSPSQIVENLYSNVRAYAAGAPQFDDITSVVCKVV